MIRAPRASTLASLWARGQPGGLDVVAGGATDAGVPVRGHADAKPGAADRHPAPRVPPQQDIGQPVPKVGIVYRLVGVRTQIQHRRPGFGEPVAQLLLERVAGVVCRERDWALVVVQVHPPVPGGTARRGARTVQRMSEATMRPSSASARKARNVPSTPSAGSTEP